MSQGSSCSEHLVVAFGEHSMTQEGVTEARACQYLWDISPWGGQAVWHRVTSVLAPWLLSGYRKGLNLGNGFALLRVVEEEGDFTPGLRWNVDERRRNMSPSQLLYLNNQTKRQRGSDRAKKRQSQYRDGLVYTRTSCRPALIVKPRLRSQRGCIKTCPAPSPRKPALYPAYGSRSQGLIRYSVCLFSQVSLHFSKPMPSCSTWRTGWRNRSSRPFSSLESHSLLAWCSSPWSISHTQVCTSAHVCTVLSYIRSLIVFVRLETKKLESLLRTWTLCDEQHEILSLKYAQTH